MHASSSMMTKLYIAKESPNYLIKCLPKQPNSLQQQAAVLLSTVLYLSGCHALLPVVKVGADMMAVAGHIPAQLLGLAAARLQSAIAGTRIIVTQMRSDRTSMVLRSGT